MFDFLRWQPNPTQIKSHEKGTPMGRRQGPILDPYTCKVCFQIIEKSTYDKHWAHAKGHRMPDTLFPPPFSDDQLDDQPEHERNSSATQVERAPEYYGILDMSLDDPMEHETPNSKTLENVGTKEILGML